MTHHVPEDRVLQGGVANHQVEGVRARHGVEFRFPLSCVQFELVLILAVRLGHKHHFLARFLVVQSDKGLTQKQRGVANTQNSQINSGFSPNNAKESTHRQLLSLCLAENKITYSLKVIFEGYNKDPLATRAKRGKSSPCSKVSRTQVDCCHPRK